MGTRTNAKTGRDWYYAETDAAGKVAIVGNTVTLTAGDRDEDYYVTKDLGAGYIGNFTHWVDVNVTSITNNGDSLMITWGVGNAVDDFKDIDDASGDAFFIVCARDTATTYGININNIDGGALTGGTTVTGISVATASYLSITRASTTATLQIYSTAAKRVTGGSGDVGTVTLTVVDTAFRYVYALGSYNIAGTGKDISGTSSNFAII